MTYDPNVYGYVNGQPTYSRNEFVFKCRRRGPLEDDAALLAFARKVTCDWHDAGWHRTFETFCLSGYALAEPRRSLTKREFERLVELQERARASRKVADDAREWTLLRTECFADNSVEEIWRAKDGELRRVVTVWPHGD